MSEASDEEKKHAPGERKLEAAEKTSSVCRARRSGGCHRHGCSLCLWVRTVVRGVRRRVWRVVGFAQHGRLTIADASEMGRVCLLVLARDLGADGGRLCRQFGHRSRSEPRTNRYGGDWAEVKRLDIFSNAQNMYMSGHRWLSSSGSSRSRHWLRWSYATSSRIEQIPMLAAAAVRPDVGVGRRCVGHHRCVGASFGRDRLGRLRLQLVEEPEQLKRTDKRSKTRNRQRVTRMSKRRVDASPRDRRGEAYAMSKTQMSWW